VSISLGGNSLIGFAAAGRQTTTRLVSSEYPKYTGLLPSGFSAVAELGASSFAEAVERVALAAQRNTPVRLAFSPGQLVLEAGGSNEAQAAARTCRPRSPRSTCSTAWGDRLRHRQDLVHLAGQARGHHRQERRRA
jgi:DNA polymerase III beta subunit, C-terminal domain